VGTDVHRHKTGTPPSLLHARKHTVPPSFVRGLHIPCVGRQCGEILSKSLGGGGIYNTSLNKLSAVNKILSVQSFLVRQSLSSDALLTSQTTKETAFHSTHFKCHPALGVKGRDPGSRIQESVKLHLNTPESEAK
jgi:hypothetical protein